MTTKTKKAPKNKKPIEKSGKLDTLKQIQEALSGCSLTFHWWGIMRATGKDENATAAASINADADVIKTKRLLIDTKLEEWRDLARIRSAAKQWYDWHTFPYIVSGQRLFRREMRETVWGQIASYTTELATATTRLNAKRNDILEWARTKLGDAFDANLYPDDFASKFGMEIREHSIEPPSYLRHTNAEEYQRTLQRSLADIQSSMGAFQNQCMAQIGQSVGRIVSNIASDSTVRESTVKNMQDTFARIAQMRFDGTAVFKAAMEEAKGIVDGVTMFDLRNSAGTREETKKKLETLMDRYNELQTAALAKAAATRASTESTQS